jgi:hypothetical protein
MSSSRLRCGSSALAASVAAASAAAARAEHGMRGLGETDADEPLARGRGERDCGERGAVATAPGARVAGETDCGEMAAAGLGETD